VQAPLIRRNSETLHQALWSKTQSGDITQNFWFRLLIGGFKHAWTGNSDEAASATNEIHALYFLCDPCGDSWKARSSPFRDVYPGTDGFKLKKLTTLSPEAVVLRR
jgi:hypothetical protein